jgi:hypothetical protein
MTSNNKNKNKNTSTNEKAKPVEKQAATNDNDNDNKDRRNKKTAGANLTLNVMKFKSWMTEYMKNNGLTVEVMKSEEDNESEEKESKDKKKAASKDDKKASAKPKVSSMEVPKINNGDAALTAANETLCKEFLNLVMKRVGKDKKSGLYNIHRRDMIDVCQLTPELNYFFNIHLDRYNRTMPVQYCVPMKDVEEFISNEFNGNIMFTDKARSFLAYFLLSFSCDLVTVAYELLLYADKKMVGHKSITSAIRIELDGALRGTLITKINETMKNLEAANAQKNSDASDKQNAKNTNKIDSDNDNDNDDNDNNDNDDNDNNDNDDNDNNDDNENADGENDLNSDDEKVVEKKKPEKDKTKQNKNKNKNKNA